MRASLPRGRECRAMLLLYESSSPGVTAQHSYTLLAAKFRLAAVFVRLYGVESLCLIIYKLMLLSRLANSTALSSQMELTEMCGVSRVLLSGWARYQFCTR